MPGCITLGASPVHSLAWVRRGAWARDRWTFPAIVCAIETEVTGARPHRLVSVDQLGTVVASLPGFPAGTARSASSRTSCW
jgi:hypothetical protein